MPNSSLKFGVIVFPGSNCDLDCQHALQVDHGIQTELIWHKETSIHHLDAIILPGGFSYGDYLRTGAIAHNSPVMGEVKKFAAQGKPVIGICNGFQILTESGLLPGALIRNKNLKFICRSVNLKVIHTGTLFTKECSLDQVLEIPIAHGEGNYYAPQEVLQQLVENNQIIFKYSDNAGQVSTESNPNGSLLNIAGICNEQGNVLGMMPHPERATNTLIGGTDGSFIFNSLIKYLVERSS